MKFRETIVSPNGTIKVEYMNEPYKHSSLDFILKEVLKSRDDLDMQLPDLNFLHTYTTSEGTYVLIHQRL
jgi:hypothetical protein